MTLRKLLQQIGEHYDRARISFSDFFSDLWNGILDTFSNLWNAILDAPLWVWVTIGFVTMSLWAIYKHFQAKK